jgi:hypothetical protein
MFPLDNSNALLDKLSADEIEYFVEEFRVIVEF